MKNVAKVLVLLFLYSFWIVSCGQKADIKPKPSMTPRNESLTQFAKNKSAQKDKDDEIVNPYAMFRESCKNNAIDAQKEAKKQFAAGLTISGVVSFSKISEESLKFLARIKTQGFQDSLNLEVKKFRQENGLFELPTYVNPARTFAVAIENYLKDTESNFTNLKSISHQYFGKPIHEIFIEGTEADVILFERNLYSGEFDVVERETEDLAAKLLMK